ncbi:hypothetical protein FKM82_010226 [Ascaphus truei]
MAASTNTRKQEPFRSRFTPCGIWISFFQEACAAR